MNWRNMNKDQRENVQRSRESAITEIATARVSNLDSYTIFEIVGDEGIALDAAIEACERKERAKLRKLPTEKLWEIVENL